MTMAGVGAVPVATGLTAVAENAVPQQNQMAMVMREVLRGRLLTQNGRWGVLPCGLVRTEPMFHLLQMHPQFQKTLLLVMRRK